MKKLLLLQFLSNIVNGLVQGYLAKIKHNVALCEMIYIMQKLITCTTLDLKGYSMKIYSTVF